MRGNIELNIIAAACVLGLLSILVSVAMLTSLSPTQMISAQITPADLIKAIDTTVPSDTGISREGNQSSSGTPVGTPNNATLANSSSSIIQSAVLPPQLPITPVSSTSNIDDDDDDSDDGNDDDDDRTRSDDDDDGSDDANDDDDDRTSSNDVDDDSDDVNDDDRTSSSVDDDDNDDSDRRSIIIQGGGVSVSVG